MVIAKLLYTFVLVILVGMLSRELWTVWFDDRVFVGKFEVITETGPDEAAGAGFSKRIVGAQAVLARQLTEYQSKRSQTDLTFVPSGIKPVQLPPTALSGVDITVQSVNVGQVLTALRKSVTMPAEVSGTVVSRPNSVLASVEWPEGTLKGDPVPSGKKSSGLLVPSLPSEQASAMYIASSIMWSRAIDEDKDLVKYKRAQFCDFMLALSDFYALTGKSAGGTALTAPDVETLRRQAAQLRTHYGQPNLYPEIYRLRADLLDLLPASDSKLQELIDSQEDRLAYAMLSQDLQNLPAETRRLTALAMARPALLMKAGMVQHAPDNWSRMLDKRSAEIKRLQGAIGLLERGDGSPMGTGVIVGPNLLMAATHALRAAGYNGPNGKVKPPADPVMLCMGDDEKCTDKLELGEISYWPSSDSSKIALVEIKNHNAAMFPWAELSDAPASPASLTGSYAFIIGYPFVDARMPDEWNKLLLKNKSGAKRLMPGRVLSVGVSTEMNATESTGARPLRATTDISTAGGVSGAPLADLTTGRILGMHESGIWKGERGKFAQSELLTTQVREAIANAIKAEQSPSQ